MNKPIRTIYPLRTDARTPALFFLLFAFGFAASSPAHAVTIGSSSIEPQFSLFCKVKKISTTFSEPAKRAHSLWIYSTHWHTDHNGHVQGIHSLNGAKSGDTTLVIEDVSSIFSASSFHVEAIHIGLFCSGGLLTEWEDSSRADRDC